MQALKTLVIALGGLIVVSIGLLGWGFYTKLHRGEPGATAPAAAVGAQPTPPVAGAEGVSSPGVSSAGGSSFGEVRIPLPEGCAAVEMRPDAGRLFVRTGPIGLCERILVIDIATGRLLGDIVLTP